MRLVRTYKKTLSFFDFFFLSTNSLLLPISATQTTIPTNRQVSAMILILKKKKKTQHFNQMPGAVSQPEMVGRTQEQGSEALGSKPIYPQFNCVNLSKSTFSFLIYKMENITASSPPGIDIRPKCHSTYNSIIIISTFVLNRVLSMQL